LKLVTNALLNIKFETGCYNTNNPNQPRFHSYNCQDDYIFSRRRNDLWRQRTPSTQLWISCEQLITLIKKI